jgi:hypothetical protein
MIFFARHIENRELTVSTIFSRDAPDTDFAGYPAKPKAGYRISGKGRIPDIRLDTWFDKYIFGKIRYQINL